MYTGYGDAACETSVQEALYVDQASADFCSGGLKVRPTPSPFFLIPNTLYSHITLFPFVVFSGHLRRVWLQVDVGALH